MKVSELSQSIKDLDLQFKRVRLGDITFEDGFQLYDHKDKQTWLMGADNPYFLRYLQIAPKTFSNLDTQRQKDIFNYFANIKWPSDEVEIVSSGDRFIDIFKAGQRYITVEDISTVISNVFSGDDLVVDWSLHKGFKAYVIKEELSIDGHSGEDISYGGVQFVLTRDENPPKLVPLITTDENKLRILVDDSTTKINLRGLDPSELVKNMSAVGSHILTSLIPRNLLGWKHLIEVDPPDDIDQYVHRLCEEHEIASSIETALIERVPSFSPPRDSLYDLTLMCVHPEIEEGCTDVQRDRLAHLGGTIIKDAGTLHRCKECQHRLF